MPKKIRIIPWLDTSQLKKQLEQLGKEKQKVNVNIEEKGIQNITKQVEGLSKSVKNTDSIFSKLKGAIANTFSVGKLAMTGYLLVLREISNAGQDAKQAIKEIDKAVTDLQVATNMSRESVEGLVKGYNEYGKSLASTTTDITSAADDYLRAGKSLNEAQTLIKDSIMLSKLGQIESGTATEDLLAVMNGYEMSIDEVGKALDAMVALDMEAATSSGDIATALKYCASSADVAGLSFNKLSAMIATVQEKTMQGAETIGTFMNTLLSRYRNVKIGQFVDDDGEDLSEVETILGSLNVKLRDSNQEFRNFETVIEEVASAWDGYSSVQQAAIAKAFSGTRQQNRFYALMEGYSKTLELTEVAANSAGTALDKFNNSYMNSLEAKENTLQASFESMILNSDMDSVYSGILEATTALVDFINQTNLLKGALTGLTAAGAIKTFLSIRTGINEAYISLNQFQNALNIIKQTTIPTKDFDRLLLLTNSLSTSQMKLVLASQNLTAEQKKQIVINSTLSEKEKALLIQTYGLTTAEAGLTTATTTMGNAFRALWNTLLANPLVLVTTLVSGAVMAWQAYQNHLENIRQATEESANAYKEATSSIDDYVSRYKELRQALLDAKGNEEETYNIKQQLLDLQTELNDKFGEEYGKLNLVTDAYKDQTEAIKAFNKEAAQTFLNENQEGIEDAINAMTKDNRRYNLSYTGMSSYTDEGMALKEIAKKYESQGLKINEDESNGTYNLILTTDAQSAYDTINEFENDVRAKAKELGNEHIFDDVLEISSSELNKAKEIINDYGNIYKQALMAEIVTDDDRAATYNEALKAVEEYNEAVLKSEDPFNDEEVARTKSNLEQVRAEIQNNETEWEKYSAVTDELFDQADTRLLDFYDKLQNNSGLQKFAEQLKGLDRVDLKAMAGDDRGDAFDSLINAAKEYELELDEVIDLLVKLGIVQDDISSNGIEFEDLRWDYSTTLQNLDKVREKLQVLDQSYAKLFDKDEQIGFEDLSSINEAFADVEGIDNYIERIREAGKNTKEVTAVMEELITSYLECSGVLDNVTQENAELIASMLDEMGIANASELVNYALAESNAEVAAQKIIATNATLDLANVTSFEIEALVREANESELTKQKLALLALQKQMCNENIIRTDGDIANLQALAEQAGATAASIASIKSLNDRLKNAENSRFYTNDPDRLKNAWSSEYNKIYADIQKQAKLNRQQAISNGGGSSPIKYGGGSNTNKAIEQARKNAQDAAKETEDTYEKLFDFFERRIKVLQDSFDNLEKGMKNVFGADAKNALVTAQIGVVDEQINNYTDALAMYRQKANDALSGVSSDLRDKIVNGAVQITDFIGKGNEEVVEAMEAYKGWADKVADCTQKLEELKTQIRQLELQKFNNIMEEFNNQFDLRDDSINLIEKQIGLLEEAGELIGESFYSKQIEQSQKQLNILETEKTRLVQQLEDALASGRIQKGTDEWLEMANSISDVEGNILDCKTAIEEFNNELLNLNWKIFERVQTEFGNIASEMGNLADLFDDFNDIRVSDGEGTWTDQAIATLGLYAQQLELAKYQVGQYGDAIEQLKKDYQAGKYSTTEYVDKLADLSQGQWDAVKSAESLEDAIVSLNKTRVDEEIDVIEKAIDAYKEYTDSQIEALEAAKDLHDYQEEISNKTKAVADIERQLAAMQNDDTASTIAKRKKLEEQLAEARKDLEETEYEHSIESQKNALNKNYEDFENARNQDIEALRATLENRELLIFNSLETVKANAGLVGEQIALIAQEHGIIVSNAVITPWQNGENAIASYGAVLSAQSSSFIGNIMNVQNHVYGLQAQANATANSLSYMFSTRADNLVNQLTSSYYSETNLNSMTNTLQNSLINTLERGYNINSIMNALSSIASGADSVANAVGRAASALSSMGASGSGASSGMKTYTIGSTNYGEHKVTASSSSDAIKQMQKKYPSGFGWYVAQAYAKGGIVTKEDNGIFDPIAKAIGEDTMVAVKHGEGILTPEQTKILEQFAPTLDNMANTWNLSSLKNGYGIPEIASVRNERPNVTLHYDSLVTVNGDVNDTNHFINQMTKVSQKCINKTFEEMGREIRYGR